MREGLPSFEDVPMDNPYKSPRHNASIPTKSGWRERLRMRYIIVGLLALITTVIIYSGLAAILLFCLS